jgi:7-carboxy-7-deazaguanine synthase
VNAPAMANKYKLVEIFESIQGEGKRLGTVNIFVRFSFCNLSCHFCDTSYNEVNLELSEDELIHRIATFRSKSIIFTGGEPTLALRASLIHKLKDRGYYLAIETNGLKKVPEGIDWITVSPKSALSKLAQTSGDELKILFSTQKNPEDWLQLNFKHFLLAPVNDRDTLHSQNNRAVFDYVLSHPQWTFSTQVHKILKVQ